MKALTLHQPWATLWVLAQKLWETRGHDTHHRGPLLVHAGMKWTKEQAALCVTSPFIHALGVTEDQLEQLVLGTCPFPLGAIVGGVNLTDSVEMTAPLVRNVQGTNEGAFGHYEPGRFIWKADGHWALREPIGATGRQGLWVVPEKVMDQVEASGEVLW